MRFGSTAKVLEECKLKYYRISECEGMMMMMMMMHAWTRTSCLWMSVQVKAHTHLSYGQCHMVM